MQVKVDGSCYVGHHVSYGQDRRAKGLGWFENLAGLATNDHVNQLFRRGVFDAPHADHLAVAQNCDPVRNPKDLVQTMRDIDHADTLLFQRSKGPKQTLDLVSGQGGRWLIQHQKIAVHGQGTGDSHQ